MVLPVSVARLSLRLRCAGLRFGLYAAAPTVFRYEPFARSRAAARRQSQIRSTGTRSPEFHGARETTVAADRAPDRRIGRKDLDRHVADA